MVVKITVVKSGFIGVTTLIEALLDERAARKDISVHSISSGSKMHTEASEDLEKNALLYDTDFFILVTPNASLDAPKELAFNLSKHKPTLVVSDNPASKSINDFSNENLGYIVVQGDPLIGIRQEFLDPIEMSNFNSDVLKVLSITGAFRALVHEIDLVVSAINNSQPIVLPRIIVDKHKALSHSGLSNPYAKSKALASYEMAKLVGRLSAEGGYKEKDRQKYLLVVSASHELIRQAAILADEAREIEKTHDNVFRQIHDSEGNYATKNKLLDSF
tara:strand:- start:149 stop:973 length:825 start_codon:yes stop_codon:yes gene_type:complete